MLDHKLDPEDAALVSRVPPELRAANGIPDPAEAAARERAALLVREALGDLLHPGGLRTSPLGPRWSRDVDAHVQAPVDPRLLRDRGWIPLDALIRRLGHRVDGRWAIVEDGRVVGALDLHEEPPVDPVAGVLGRCRRRREVRVREVLELRALLRGGSDLPAGDEVVEAAARVEAGLGGAVLSRWRTGGPLPAPAPTGGPRSLARLGKVRHAIRPRLVIAICGVDGSGKSTLAALLVDDLRRAGVPATLVWTRPGMRIGWLEGSARTAKRILRQDPAPGVARVGRGEAATAMASRRGVLGWIWSLLVTMSFLGDVRRRHRRARGVLVCDRHLIDALVTLDVAYPGAHRSLHRWLIRTFLPPAALSVYLEVPAEVAAARKPDDLFGDEAIRSQLGAYEAEFRRVEGLRRLDGERPPKELAGIVLGWLIEPSASPPA